MTGPTNRQPLISLVALQTSGKIPCTIMNAASVQLMQVVRNQCIHGYPGLFIRSDRALGELEI